jgi:glucosamine--fructose-6-phosphate aminotransferase (isomerizing)
MTARGQHTHAEILSQPEAWRQAVQDLSTWHAEGARFFDSVDELVVIGCGSTYYLAHSAAGVFQAHSGRSARALPASEVWLNPTALPAGRRIGLVAVSRSGETTETLRACLTARARGVTQVMTLSCYPNRALTGLGDVNVVLPSGQEQSVAQTRAFSTLYFGWLSLVATWAEAGALRDALARAPEACATLLNACQATTTRFGQDLSLERFYFLGSGLRYGIAAEMSLKMKEMSLSHSEPFHVLEFRHGPMSMVTPETLIVTVQAEALAEHESAVVHDMARLGARTLIIGAGDTDIPLPGDLGETVNSLLALTAGQRLAFERAMARGLNPDRPHNLETVVTLK